MSDDYDTRREEASAQTSRDRRRTRVAEYERSVDVAWWQCRHPQCDERIGVCAAVVDHLATCNRELARRGEREIPADSVLVCSGHAEAVRAHRLERLREQRVRLAATIHELSQLDEPSAAYELVARLRADHHPDIVGLVAAIEAQAARKTGGRRRVEL